MEKTLLSITEWFSGFPEWALCLILFALALVQYVFPPVPSDTLLVALGMLVSNGVFNKFFGFGSYVLGAVVGALALFEVSYFLGDKIKKIKLINRLFDEKTLEKSRVSIEKYGGGSYFILRFVPSMQCVTIIVMGLLRVKKARARFYISAVTIMACCVYYLLGLLLGANIPALVRILDTLGVMGWVLLAAVAVVIIVILIIYKTKKKDK